MDYVYLALVLASLLLYGLLPFFWLARHIVRLRYGAGFGMDLLLVSFFALFALSLYIIASPYIYVKNEMPSYAQPLGFAVVVLCLAVEAWSLYLLGKNSGFELCSKDIVREFREEFTRRSSKRRRADRNAEHWNFGKAGLNMKLITSGPYRAVRHPIYLSHTAINFGIYLATGAVIPLLVFAEWLLLIKPLADIEDEELALRMEEEFVKYRKKVPQLIPRLK